MLLSTVTRPFSSEELVEWREKVQKDSAKLLDMCKAAGTWRERERASRGAPARSRLNGLRWLACDGWLAGAYRRQAGHRQDQALGSLDHASRGAVRTR